MANVRSIVEDAVRAAVGQAPIGDVDIAFGHDRDDEEACLVAVDVPPSTPRLGGEKLLAAITGVNDALIASGELRFAHLRFRHIGEEAADEGEPAGISDP